MQLFEMYAASGDQNWWDLDETTREEWRDYMREHIGDPKVVSFPLVVEEGGEDQRGRFVIRYQEYLLNEQGQKYLLPKSNVVAQRTRWVVTDASPPGL
jgi:hypothetical protein